jgi:hypothetical protein
VLDRLVRLPEPALQRASACPFVLFELRLAHVIETSNATESPWTREPGVADRASAPGDPREQLFVQQALFFAWHLACTSPLTGRLALGSAAAQQSALRALSPSCFSDRCASEDVLRPRWPHHERFWIALLDAAESGSETQLRRTHCFGIQLLAAESVGLGEDPDAARAPR